MPCTSASVQENRASINVGGFLLQSKTITITEDCILKGEKPLPALAAAFLLDQDVAYQRKVSVNDQTDGIFTSDVLNASPGEVVAASDHLVQYRCSILPQMSSGPWKSYSIIFLGRWELFAERQHPAHT